MFHIFCTWITNSSTRRIEIRNNTKSGLKIWSSSWTYTTGSNPSTVKSSQVSSNLFVSLARPSRYIRERCILLRKTFVGNEKREKKREHGMPGGADGPGSSSLQVGGRARVNRTSHGKEKYILFMLGSWMFLVGWFVNTS